ncbi:NAD(P)-dependent oxidoreductase [Kitasatospora griseola]|uniref:NAD(P)-dependent oxidoreductase n=1 Tax=Kitasatospora griseola TaxID=2064 RepID=UPI0038225D7C
MTAGQVLGVLHPGSMGAAVAACAVSTGTRVLWCPAGRSEASVRRAEQAGLEPVPTLEELLAQSDVVLSLCPPAAAEDVADQVAAVSFTGVFVEGNAISPMRMSRIVEKVGSSAAVVDGAVIGSPPVGTKHCKLFLSGPADATGMVGALFTGTAVSVPVLGTDLGRASALKLSYTAYQKTSRVLAALAYGLAEHHGVDQELLSVAGERSGSYLVEIDYIAKTAARGWRWAPELEEAADALNAAGLPDELLRTSAAILDRWLNAKDRDLTAHDALAMLREGQ